MSIKCLFLVYLFSASQAQPAQEIFLEAGKYIGMEYMGESDVTPNDKTDRWYYENTLIIKGNSLLLKKVPVVFYKDQQKRYSASDGGFYSYLGTVQRNKNKIIVELRMTSNEYGIAQRVGSVSRLVAKSHGRGIILDNVIYKKY